MRRWRASVSKQGHFYTSQPKVFGFEFHCRQTFMPIGILGKNLYQYNFEILNKVIFHGVNNIHSLLQQLNKMLWYSLKKVVEIFSLIFHKVGSQIKTSREHEVSHTLWDPVSYSYLQGSHTTIPATRGLDWVVNLPQLEVEFLGWVLVRDLWLWENHR